MKPSVVDAWLRLTRTLRAATWAPRCVLCGRQGQHDAFDLCGGCEGDLPANDHHCEICAQPLQLELSEARLCGMCLQRRPRFDRTSIPFRYSYPMDHLIRRLKYGGGAAVGRVLGDLIAQRIAASARPTMPQALIPVPLAQRRFCERGYNQAMVLAERIHLRTKLPLRTDILVRTRDTLEQAGLDQRARRKNIRKAFEVINTPPLNVAVIDDVVTTGSTVNEIARVLKRAGAQRVEVWAVARAGR